MKTCTKCNTEKASDGFRQWRTVCRKCENIVARDHHRNNSDEINKRKISKNRERYQEKRRFLVDYLQNHPCVDCGETRVACLEFDHVMGEKKDKISTVINYGWKALKDEIEKCEVRCANCHAVVTAKRAKWWWAEL